MNVVDARGHRCPVPTLKLRKALDSTPAGGLVRVLADDPMAKIDIPHFAAENGHRVHAAGEENGVLAFTIKKGP